MIIVVVSLSGQHFLSFNWVPLFCLNDCTCGQKISNIAINFFVNQARWLPDQARNNECGSSNVFIRAVHLSIMPSSSLCHCREIRFKLHYFNSHYIYFDIMQDQ